MEIRNKKRMDNGSGNSTEMKISQLKRSNEIFKNRIQTLKIQLEETSKNSVEISDERDALALKCKLHEANIDILEKKYLQKLYKLYEACQEILNLQDMVTQLQYEIEENRRIQNGRQVTQQETIVDINDTPEINTEGINNNFLNIPANQEPREELALYNQCKAAVDENLGNPEPEGRTEKEYPSEDEDTEPCEMQDEKDDLESGSEIQELSTDSEDTESEDSSRETKTCKWMVRRGKRVSQMCGKVLQSFELNAHFREVHAAVPGRKGYACFWDGCKRYGVSFTRKDHLLRHFRIHLGTIKEVCPECSKVFAHRSSMVAHRRKKHEG